ncbi:MAG: hypothetical protein IBJ10_01120 [Phycisphaerales bacterium]|nr:hypothetical protein [Phycisphaerales bacterium]
MKHRIRKIYNRIAHPPRTFYTPFAEVKIDAFGVAGEPSVTINCYDGATLVIGEAEARVVAREFSRFGCTVKEAGDALTSLARIGIRVEGPVLPIPT